MKKALIAALFCISMAGVVPAQETARSSAADVEAHNRAIAKALAAASPAKAAVEQFRLRTKLFPSNNADAGMNLPDSFRNYDVKRIAVNANGVIDITLTETSGVDDGVIRLTPKPSPSTGENAVEWTCASASYAAIADATGGVCEYTNQP